MYDYEYEEEDGLSLLDLLKISFGTNKKSRIRFLVVFVVTALAIFLSVGVFYNNSKTNYVARFDYQIPSMIETVTNDGNVTKISYLDGSEFNINSLISLDNLKEVKESSNEFVNVNIDAIYEATAFEVSFDSSNQFAFTIVINKNYFKNSDQAKKFISKLVELPLNVTKSLVEKIDNSIYLKQAISEDSTLMEELNNLVNQANHIINEYTLLVNNAEKTGMKSVTIDDKLYALSDLKNVANTKVDKLELQLLINEAELNHYVRNYSSTEVQNALVLKRDSLQYESNQLKDIIDNYHDMMTGGNLTNTAMNQYVSYLDRKAEVDKELKVYDAYVSSGVDSTPIEAKVTKAYNELKNLTDELTEVQKASYREDLTSVYYEKNSVVTESKRFSTIIIVAISLVAGLLVAIIVNLVMGVSKYKELKDTNISNNTVEGKSE